MRLLRLLVTLVALSGGVPPSVAAEPADIKIGYLRWAALKPTISFVQLPSENDGVAGAQLAIEDNNTTGKFLDQRFSLDLVPVRDGDDPRVAALALADRGVALVIADLPADALLKAADGGRE